MKNSRSATRAHGASLAKQATRSGPVSATRGTANSPKAMGLRPALLAIARELSKRAKLTRFNTVDDAANLISRSKNIICLTGAGISTSLGIPDFRSKGTGLYSKLEHLGLSDPQEVFDIDQFKADPTVFYSVAKDILPSTDRFTPTHAFIALLQEKGKLLTNYSQNIDNLEAKAGIHPSKLVQCHGSFATATCIECGYKADGESIFPEIRDGILPRCPQCTKNLRPPAGNGKGKRKRSRGAEAKKRKRGGRDFDDFDDDDDDGSEFDIPEAGVMKPDITFFGEALPDDFGQRLTEHDRDLVDLVIYISRTPVDHLNFDIDLLGDCDVVVAELCRRMGWNLEHEMIPRGQAVDVGSVDGFVSRWVDQHVNIPYHATR
ncbi:unnamed protein product [Parascedosporium putredinis]|uniref:Deacetylase sirtuin-type domain-containing protein n=1 Tax=Parascedosporium putredinis TaxID=1442378 RepID=A0A9P1MF85_9PEZI|nr:unnamed protein product [Parascedosporium putredinis]CAI8004529.1 unnamed protein product [Parascedosporium putredinis]